MRVESYLVAELLQRMEQQNAALRPFTVDLVTNLNAEEPIGNNLITTRDVLAERSCSSTRRETHP